MNQLAPVVRKNKNELTTSQKNLSSRESIGSKLKLYIYLEISILIAMTIFSLMIIMNPFDKMTKVVLTMILAGLSILNLYLIYYVFNNLRRIENFVNNMDISMSNISFMNAASEFLVNTENLTILLESNSIYTNTNQSLTKEISYYEDASQQLNIRTQEVGAVYKTSYMTQVHYNAIMQLCNTLALTIVGFTTMYITLETFNFDNVSYTLLFSITGIIILIALAIYIFEATSRVRSDPKKIYWSNPSSNTGL
jgi:hypothetical protein